MGVISIQINKEPEVDVFISGDLSIDFPAEDSVFLLKESHFTTDTSPEFFSSKGDEFVDIKVVSLPVGVELIIQGNVMEENELNSLEGVIIDKDKLNRNICGLRKIEGSEYTQAEFIIQFKDPHTGVYENDFRTVEIDMPIIENSAPDETGSGEVVLGEGSEHIITRDDLLVDLDIPYSDPEGDEAYSIRVTKLPSEGIVYLGVTPVNVGQEISFSSIDLGFLKYVSNGLVVNENGDSFEYEVSDSGSKTFN